MINFIDFDTVDRHTNSSIEAIVKLAFYSELDLSKQPLRRFNFVEHRVTLMDELFQLIATPKTFSYLNFIQESVTEFSEAHDPENSIITFIFDLANQVKIENRKVNSITEVFGDLYGIKDFLVFIFSFILGSFPARFYL